jgi:ElaB/YqjD/DUF883 family membrane-anchored ribosome-binding protein
MVERISAGQLIDDLTAVIRDAESLLRATAAQTGEKVEEVRAKERLSGLEEETLRHAREMAGEADVYVRGNPWQAVGIAAGVGLLIGLLMSRR